MKRFSKIVSIALVALLAIALVGCSTTSTVESVPEIVLPAAAPATPAPSPAPAPAPVPASADEPVAEEVVEVVAPAVAEELADEYPFGVTPIVKNTQGDDVFDLFIIHTNDVHARVTAGEDDGAGYAKLATIIKTARSITNNVLVLDAGDVTQRIAQQVAVRLLQKLPVDLLFRAVSHPVQIIPQQGEAFCKRRRIQAGTPLISFG